MTLNPKILEALRRRQRGRRVPKATRLLFPIAQAQEYESVLRRSADSFGDDVITGVIKRYGVRKDAPSEDAVIAFIRSMAQEANQTAQRNAAIYEAQGRRIAENQQAQLEAQIRNVLGIDINTASRRVRRELDVMVRNNVGLITRANQDLLAQVEASVSDAFLNDRSTTTLEDTLRKRAGILGNRTQLIARDQTNKFFGAVTEARHLDLGVVAYFWSTALDERVRGNPGGRYPRARPSHWDREGKRFLYESPPEDGHPGTPVQCRCTQTPDFEGLLDG